MSYGRFGIAVLIIVLAVLLQWRAPALVGVRPDFVLAALVTLGFFMRWQELLPLVLGSAWVLNSRPAVGWETAWFIVIPFLVMFLQQFSPFKRWPTAMLGVFLGVALFHLGADYVLLRQFFWTMTLQALIGSLAGAFFFLIIRTHAARGNL